MWPRPGEGIFCVPRITEDVAFSTGAHGESKWHLSDPQTADGAPPPHKPDRLIVQLSYLLSAIPPDDHGGLSRRKTEEQESPEEGFECMRGNQRSSV